MKKEKLHITLICPKFTLRPMDSEFKRRMSPSLTLVTVASLTPQQHEVKIIDENITKIDFDVPTDLVGISVNVDTSYKAIEIARKYREKGVTVVFGGIHASANYKEMLEFCDSVCVGDAEMLWPRMIEDAQQNRLKKVYSNSEETNLDNVPIPNWNLISKEHYLFHNVIVTSRGCPFKCEFCYNSCEYITSRYRNRPIENVIEEIEALDTKQVMFIDDNLIGNIEWTHNFIDRIIPMNLTWHAAVSTDLVHHPQLIDKMAEAGCRSLFIGFESINSASIASVKKCQNRIEDYERLIATLHSKSIMVNASLVFGFDYDTVDTFKDSVDWLIKNSIESVTSHILTPYPGTMLHKRLVEEERIIDEDLSHYNTAHVVFQPKGMSPEELFNGYMWVYREFYSIKNIFKRRPKRWFEIVPYLIFNVFYRKLGKYTSFMGSFGYMNRVGKVIRRICYGVE